MSIVNKVLIVEGKSDKRRVEEVLLEPVDIICTNGTMGVEKLDAMIEELYDRQVYILSDADSEGRKIRKWFKKHLSESTHIYIDPKFTEVGRCPRDYLANLLMRHEFYVDTGFVWKGKFKYHERHETIERYINAYSI